MTERTNPEQVDTLPEPVVALLRAVHDALDIPLPGATDADERAYDRLLDRRAMHARVTLACILQDGHGVGRSAAVLRDLTSREPVTYTPWIAAGGER
ncbi:hypothetical protein ACGFX8_10445 [Streptomyces sp. NPDC048362]|uniref:hypothetical protein n=1 Tax=Streptomyces sp. NPDC048362 TaxID=3365539 RepID=UPI00371ED5D3